MNVLKNRRTKRVAKAVDIEVIEQPGRELRFLTRAGRPVDYTWNEWLIIMADRHERGTSMHAVLMKLKPGLTHRRLHVRAQTSRTQFLDMCRQEGVGGRAELDAANELFRILCRAKNKGTNLTNARRRRLRAALMNGERDYTLEPELHSLINSGEGYTTDLIRLYFRRFDITADRPVAKATWHTMLPKGPKLSSTPGKA